MKQDEIFVITINRELGSGGRTIGRKLAERLEVPFYDKSLIHQLEKKYSLTSDEIERLKGQDHNWWAEFKRSIMMMPNYVAPQVLSDYSNMPDFLITDDIFQAETEILKGIAADGSCVIAGRSGFYIFRDHPNHLSVLIQASMKHRIERVMRKQSVSAEEAKAIIEKVDETRENYVNKYTGSSRYDTRNYDLVINADDHSEDEIVEMIIHYLKLPLSKIIF
jgi:cytidylate kinase